MTTIKILSPAKINLMLRILGQREDGYHLLQTYFHILNWGDWIEFTTSPKDTITINGSFGELPLEQNLIYQAIELLRPYRKEMTGLNITVNKNIPQGSGLGGGSSNAGTTLNVINKLWHCGLTQQQIREMGLSLGADVPVFVLNQSAMAYGVGEKLQPLKLPHKYFVLIFPETSINTVDVFNKQSLDRNQKTIDAEKIHEKEYWTNACLPVVLQHYPEVKNIYQQASKHQNIYMSGTGSTLFSVFDSKTKAQQFIDSCPSHWRMQLCQSKID